MEEHTGTENEQLAESLRMNAQERIISCFFYFKCHSSFYSKANFYYPVKCRCAKIHKFKVNKNTYSTLCVHMTIYVPFFQKTSASAQNEQKEFHYFTLADLRNRNIDCNNVYDCLYNSI